jgi:hypothetical protein
MNTQTILAEKSRPVFEGYVMDSRFKFDWLDNHEQIAVMTACKQAGQDLQGLVVMMFEDHITISFVDWEAGNCGVALFHRLGGNATMALLQLQQATIQANQEFYNFDLNVKQTTVNFTKSQTTANLHLIV